MKLPLCLWEVNCNQQEAFRKDLFLKTGRRSIPYKKKRRKTKIKSPFPIHHMTKESTWVDIGVTYVLYSYKLNTHTACHHLGLVRISNCLFFFISDFHNAWTHTLPMWKLTTAGQFTDRIGKLVKRLTHRPKGTGFDPCLDHKSCSTWATNSFSIWDNKDLLILLSARA
jgi:hypothetical protein